MPLSEHEQRLLEQMERALYAEDSKFVQTFRGSDSRRKRRRQLGLAVVGFVVGLGLLFVGVAVPGFLWVGPVGFLVMLGSALYLLYASRRETTPLEVISGGLDPNAGSTPAAPRPRASKQSRRAGLMARVEERWRRRGTSGGY
jgi:hypothetical protein